MALRDSQKLSENTKDIAWVTKAAQESTEKMAPVSEAAQSSAQQTKDMAEKMQEDAMLMKFLSRDHSCVLTNHCHGCK